MVLRRIPSQPQQIAKRSEGLLLFSIQQILGLAVRDGGHRRRHRLAPLPVAKHPLHLHHHLICIKIAHQHHGLVLRLVPAVVEVAHQLLRTVLHDVHIADGRTSGIDGVIVEVVLQLLYKRGHHPGAPFLHNHVVLALHVLGGNRGIAGPVAQQQQTGVHQHRVVHGNPIQLVAHRCKAREGVGVVAKLESVALGKLEDAAREMLRALKLHMLHEVGYASLVVLLHHRPRFHQQVEIRQFLRTVVLAHIIRQSVVQHPPSHHRVLRNRLFVNHLQIQAFPFL